VSESITKFVDDTLKTLLFTKFGDLLDIDVGIEADEDKINKGVIQSPKETALRNIAEKRGEDFLEFINFWRMGTSPAWDRQRTAVARRGIWLTALDADRLKAINIKAQPVDLQYNAWFWSKDLDKIYQCIERYIFWQQDYPKIDLTYTFDSTHTFSCSPELHFGEIVDESTAESQYQQGLIFVYKMPIKVDAWVLQGYDFHTITKIVLTIYDKGLVTNYSEIVIPDSNQDVELANTLKMSTGILYGIDSIILASNQVVVPNDRSSDFTAGDRIRIWESTSNDESYVINSVAVVAGKTVLGLTGALTDDTADGVVYKVS
jgi:hypothetical protein